MAIKRNTPLKLEIRDWNITFNVNVNGKELGTYDTNGVGSREVSIPASYFTDQSVSITVARTDVGNMPHTSVSEHVDPKIILADETAYGDPVTLQDGAWSHSWDNLPVTDTDGNPLRYTVKEEGVSGYTASYTNNEGIQTGAITVTNTKEKESGYTLPNTGGPGMAGIAAVGAALILAAGAGLAFRRRRRS